MTSEAQRNNTASDAASPPEAPAKRLIGGMATEEEIYVIDRAALEDRMDRGPWLVKVAVEQARIRLEAAGSR